MCNINTLLSLFDGKYNPSVWRVKLHEAGRIDVIRDEERGGLRGQRGSGWGVAALHHKNVVPILGILSTNATYYLSWLLSFKF